MNIKDRYSTIGLSEDMYEPGSDNKVLKNKLVIQSTQAMDEEETRSYLSAMHAILDIYDENHQFTANDICKIHNIWLGEIYDWAGQYRNVNISKAGFTFAMARQVPDLMLSFENGPLKEFTPCNFSSHDSVIHALAIVHTELVLIHPFRDGNGRLARMLSVIMGLQAGLPPLNFECMEGQIREKYFAAVQSGMACDYRLMEDVFKLVLESSF